MQLTFVGTGGGRFTMIEQLRRTGGMHLHHDDFSLYIDPGPGALVHAMEQDIALNELDAILVTHAHLDHYSDMNVLIEAMTSGGDAKQGTVLANTTVLHGAALPQEYMEGKGTYGTEIAPVLDDYHAELPETVVELQDGGEHDIGPFTLRCIETRHSDPHTVAFTLTTEERSVGFVSDTELFDGLADFFEDVDVLVMNVARPKEKEWKGHLTIKDAATVLNEVQPAFAVLQHFGAALIYDSVPDQEKWLQDQTDVDFVMAEDGMNIDLLQPKQGLERFF